MASLDGTAGYLGNSQEYGSGYSTGTQPGGMYGPSGAGWGGMTPTQKYQLAQLLGFTSVNNPAQPFADIENQRMKVGAEYAKAAALGAKSPNTGGSSGPAQIHPWNPAILAQLIQLIGQNRGA